MSLVQKLTGKARIAAGKGTISSSLLRELNAAAVDSQTSNSEVNIFTKNI